MTTAPKTANPLVFLDIETTHLDPRLADVIEAAWAVEDEDTNQIIFEHTLEHADPEALRINRYWERGMDRSCGDGRGVTPHRMQFIRDLTGATIVAENYGFDCGHLLRKLGLEPWHYRKVELSSLAMYAFGLDRPEGQTKTAVRMRDLGYEIPEDGMHEAVGDVECLRACFRALMDLRARTRGPADQLPIARTVVLA